MSSFSNVPTADVTSEPDPGIGSGKNGEPDPKDPFKRGKIQA
jgi:hypothetical protein